MTTIPLVLLLATAAYGYRPIGIVGVKSLETSTRSDLENDISNEPNYAENQNRYIGNNAETNNVASNPTADTEIFAKPEGQLATGCFGVAGAIPEPAVNNHMNQISFPDSPPNYPSRPDPLPLYTDTNTYIPPFPEMPPRPYIPPYTQPFIPPSPMFPEMPFSNRPPPLVIVKTLQPIILPVVEVVPESTTPDYEDIETNQLNNGRYHGRRFDRHRLWNRMPFERQVRQPIIKGNNDMMRFSVKVY